MDTTTILKWLGLPPGPWPPDDRALLGLPPEGLVDEAEAEQNALARMEQLRPHQLVNPELVTEGMNRLAQALIAVTTISVEPAPPPPLRSTAPKPASVSIPAVLEAEVIEVTAVNAAPTRPPTVPLPPPVLIHEPDPEPVLLAEEPQPPGTGAVVNRRKAYRELVFLRRLRKLWERIGPVAGAPNDPLRTPEAVYITRTAGRELRALLGSFPAASTIVGRDGRLVTAVFTQPHAPAVIRDLVPDQRSALAADWVAGRTMIETGYAALRSALRNSVPRNRMRSMRTAVGEFLRANPEWVLVALTVVLILTGFLRFLTRPSPAT